MARFFLVKSILFYNLCSWLCGGAPTNGSKSIAAKRNSAKKQLLFINLKRSFFLLAFELAFVPKPSAKRHKSHKVLFFVFVTFKL